MKKSMNQVYVSGSGSLATALAVRGPGLLLCAGIAAIAWTVGKVEEAAIGHPVIEALVVAMLIGVVIGNVTPPPKWLDAGGKFASKYILEASVFLLGASVNARQILDAGARLLLLIAAAVIFGIIVTWLVGRVLGLHSKLALLVGVGNSICGNSAIAAVAPVIGATADDVAAAIGLTAVVGVVQILFLPFLVPALGLTDYQYGVIAGVAVYAVPQVVAAAFTVSVLSGQVATLVKLIRILFIGPTVLTLGALHAAGHDGMRTSILLRLGTFVPWFVAGFLMLATLRSTGVIGESLASDVKEISTLLIIVAMAGLGLGVNLRTVRDVGARVAITVVISMAFLLTLSLIGTYALNLRG